MKGVLLISLLLCFSLISCNSENQVKFFVQGMKYLVQSFAYDITHWSEPATEDAYKTVAELIMTAGYRFETHKIVTPDKYINTAWRIIGKLDDHDHPERKPCVVLQHGLLDNSATWLIQNASTALPFLLADEGYDVWMTNSRGNIHSYEHMKPSVYNVHKVNSPFYNFTWDDMGNYDVPSNIDYILKHTNYKKVFYIGHSQGTTQFFVSSDVVPDLADKIQGFIGLGPVMYVGNMYSPYLRLIMKTGIFEFLDRTGFHNFLLFPSALSPIIRYVAIHMRHFIWRFIGLICGIDEEIRVDLTRMPVMGNFEPGGTSIMNLLHWIRMIRSGEFSYHDYGSKSLNMEHYGQDTPPL